MLYYIYLGILLVTFFCSLRAFWLQYPFHLKLFSILLGLTVVTEFFADAGMRIWHYKTNMPVYNVYMLLAFWIYGFYYSFILKSNIIKFILSIYLIFFPIFWFITVFFIFGIINWNSYMPLCGGVFTIFFSAAYLYQIVHDNKIINLWKSAEYFIALALIIYYTINIPYLGMLNFLQKNYLNLADRLIDLIDFMNIIMYSIFAYAFICRRVQ